MLLMSEGELAILSAGSKPCPAEHWDKPIKYIILLST